MLHPIFSTVLRHPELFAAHAANYSALLRLEAAQASSGGSDPLPQPSHA